jgi:GT2 family glycosyltransferase
MNRPECIAKCLRCLEVQVPAPDQIIVVDGSRDGETRRICEQNKGVAYLRNELGYGHMTRSRNIALEQARGEIVIFLDDDAFAHDGWLKQLLLPYADANVGGVGGRALNNQPGEEARGVDEIGKLQSSGRITGNFAANPGRWLEVDHLIGCNMSWRRSILADLGGLRDDYPGTEVREETDLAIRVRKVGYRLIFQPEAVVTHIGAPQAKGRRFDTRYAYYASRNHAVLLIRNFGILSEITLRNTGREIAGSASEACTRYMAATARLFARMLGLTAGTFAGIGLRMRVGKDPRRNDSRGLRIREALASTPGLDRGFENVPREEVNQIV